ncbi:methionine--tRNA ligase [Longimicrobium terrae]|uniref:Methionine--tRNA ligase n=1 Tax=Longimicrobium terrae TaxID=1639882 RepID=A0A841H0B5_9BACT|nr:methionyl-tRNA synthetase [Longimicrobium terrae]MBB6071505.1 methionyl-tRNA synthetase [Longimicrobium terrae]NNC30072.1 methionine--tRNA ligase [Longimicrobium terrae]
MSRFYLTTAIDYANGDPHLGHAFEKIGADTIARYHRLIGDEVRFCMGMDEHGQKVAQTAAARGVDPQTLVDELAGRFAEMWKRLNISNDRWVRTTDAHHRRGVRALIERALERSPGDFYEKSYEGWYCVGCELFKRENEIQDGHCVLHPTRELQWTEERNWFFRLTNYQDFLRAHFDANPDFLRPASRRNEILALMDSGLEDISITRARLSWAIPFPRPTSDGVEQGTWVWFDALPNYLTDTGYPDADWEAWWPAQLHVVGKDITRLHAVIWPAMLQSAGLPLPEGVWGHGFVTLGGEKFSKSSGVSLELDEAITRFGPDAFRFFLLREVPWDSDGAFSWERFTDRYTSELANGLGNLASRATSMIGKYHDGVVPASSLEASADIADAVRRYRAAMDAHLLHTGAEVAFEVVRTANALVAEKQPWKMAKDPALAGELDVVLATMVRYLAASAVLLSPFMPAKTAELWARLGSGRDSLAALDELAALDVSGWKVQPEGILFPRPEAVAAA